jgi:hypothetical protein
MTEDERHATLDECFEHNDHLRANGHLVAEVPLQPPETAVTLYWKNGKVGTTDGPMRKPRNRAAPNSILKDTTFAIASPRRMRYSPTALSGREARRSLTKSK